jgi:hypothetical protein
LAKEFVGAVWLFALGANKVMQNTLFEEVKDMTDPKMRLTQMVSAAG